MVSNAVVVMDVDLLLMTSDPLHQTTGTILMMGVSEYKVNTSTLDHWKSLLLVGSSRSEELTLKMLSK